MFLQELGDALRARRTQLGLTQTDVASSLQVTAQAVSKWERGENAPDIALLPQLAHLLGVSIDHLFSFSKRESTIDATVLSADIEGFGPRVANLNPEETARVLNGHYTQLTECVLAFDGIPIKYMGDELLCFFTGEDHRIRAV